MKVSDKNTERPHVEEKFIVVQKYGGYDQYMDPFKDDIAVHWCRMGSLDKIHRIKTRHDICETVEEEIMRLRMEGETCRIFVLEDGYNIYEHTIELWQIYIKLKFVSVIEG